MTSAAFLETLQSRGVELFLGPAGDLRFRAPVGVLTDRVRETLRGNRAALTAYLRDQERHNLPGSVFSGLPGLPGSREMIDDACRAARNGIMTQPTATLGDGSEIGTPGPRLLSLRAEACELSKEHGEKWLEASDGKRIIADITSIAQWWHDLWDI